MKRPKKVVLYYTDRALKERFDKIFDQRGFKVKVKCQSK
jgi:hypothetical protein